jgi:hypothetical protein
MASHRRPVPSRRKQPIGAASRTDELAVVIENRVFLVEPDGMENGGLRGESPTKRVDELAPLSDATHAALAVEMGRKEVYPAGSMQQGDVLYFLCCGATTMEVALECTQSAPAPLVGTDNTHRPRRKKTGTSSRLRDRAPAANTGGGGGAGMEGSDPPSESAAHNGGARGSKPVRAPSPTGEHSPL